MWFSFTSKAFGIYGFELLSFKDLIIINVMVNCKFLEYIYSA